MKKFDTFIYGGMGYLCLRLENILWHHHCYAPCGTIAEVYIELGTSAGVIRVCLIENTEESSKLDKSAVETGACMVCGMEEYEWGQLLTWLEIPFKREGTVD